MTWLAGLACAAMAVTRFVTVGEDRAAHDAPLFRTHLALLAVAVAVIGLLAFVARLLPGTAARRTPGPFGRLVAAGAALYVGVLLVPNVLAENGVAMSLFLGYLAYENRVVTPGRS